MGMLGVMMQLHPENFERTINIEINMQLAADTQRKQKLLQPHWASNKFLKNIANEANNPGYAVLG